MGSAADFPAIEVLIPGTDHAVANGVSVRNVLWREVLDDLRGHGDERSDDNVSPSLCPPGLGSPILCLRLPSMSPVSFSRRNCHFHQPTTLSSLCFCLSITCKKSIGPPLRNIAQHPPPPTLFTGGAGEPTSNYLKNANF